MMRQQKFFTFLISLILGISLFAFKPQAVKAQTAIPAYGRLGHVITPVNLRGRWVYHGSKVLGQNPRKLYKVRIGKHRINGIKLYQANLKQTEQYAQHFRRYHFIVDLTMNWGRATIFNRDGRQWFNVNGWTAGAGNGTSYTLTTKMEHGQAEPVLAIGIGYKPFIVAYARLVARPHYPYQPKQF